MYIVRQKETGTIISHFLNEDLAHRGVRVFEELDKAEGVFEPDSYEVWNEERWIYDVNERRYYELEMFIPPFVADNFIAVFMFRNIQDSENRLLLSEIGVKKFYGGEKFLKYWRENHVC